MNYEKFDVKTVEVCMRLINILEVGNLACLSQNTNILLVSQLYGQKGAK